MQDAFALESHRRALDAIASGRFADEIVPLDVTEVTVEDGRPPHGAHRRRSTPTKAPAPTRRLEALARLRPVFRMGGSVTAGNASQTSDGAAASLVVAQAPSRRASLAPTLARVVSFALAGCCRPR